ncbi:hypothetical protein I6F07_31105 [Ensifer sp. IC4062]|nr:hypothetical protein [Ensifer sp. IC4062]MCA1444554.1 hypothetical protein [Ensifer sp. IC4062]
MANAPTAEPAWKYDLRVVYYSGMEMIPDVVTHNYDPAHGPFRNICELPDSEAERILQEIRKAGCRSIKLDYLSRRRLTEDWLIQERRQKLGATKLERPIYFFLGDFADGKDRSRPLSIVMRLQDLPPEILTFTYPDSMASLPIATRGDHRPYRKPYHGHVFTLDEIRSVVAEFGMPGGRCETEPAMKYDKFIEVQIWDDRPLKDYLAAI